jgi:glycosyltransferase involved in cell wall biosynthesis
MASAPRVSAILIFLDEERFLEEAIASVRAQTLEDWELLLVDDGSTDASSVIARRHAAADPKRVRYIEHPGHANLGPSAARNAGLATARGEFVAFLDGDDVWLPERLARAIALLDTNSHVGMAYGRTQYWKSWSGTQAPSEDWVQPHGIRAGRTIDPPELLRMYLDTEAAVPCIGSLTVRRKVALSSGGFVDEFRGLYEDQVFLARICIDHAVYVSDGVWDRYRQHPDSACATAAGTDAPAKARAAYHAWLIDMLKSRGMHGTAVWDAAVRAQAPPDRRWHARVLRAMRRAMQRADNHP